MSRMLSAQLITWLRVGGGGGVNCTRVMGICLVTIRERGCNSDEHTKPPVAPLKRSAMHHSPYMYTDEGERDRGATYATGGVLYSLASVMLQ